MTAGRTHVTAEDLPGLLRSVLAALSQAREEVDALNVFPVPDGDTGTNLRLTVQSAVEALDDLGPGAAPHDIARMAARGALRGAAGNSGVIFSQVVRAFAEHVVDRPLTAEGLGDLLAAARHLSYEAVADPLPGTILSAMDAAVLGGVAEPGDDLADVLRRVLAAVGDAVAESRDVLEANRVAGVVDAGARGFEVALDGVLAFLEGRTVEVAPPPPIRRVVSDLVVRESGALHYEFEVQYLIEAADEVAGHLRQDLEIIGDSVVVVACGGLVNVHVHTNDVDTAVALGAAHGPTSRLVVTRFEDQIAAHRTAEGARTTMTVRSAVGYVAVVPGSALGRLVHQLGATVVDGTAGALPTVATVLNAVGTVEADEVVLLPGHPNVVPTMHQASAVSVAEGGRALHVVETATSVPAVLATLAVAPSDRLDLDDVRGVAAAVRSGEVVAAVRDADTPLGPVGQGQLLGVVAGQVVAVDDDVLHAVEAVVRGCVAPGTELVTLLAGAEVDDDERARVHDMVGEAFPDLDVELLDGGQRPARWIVGAE